MAINIYSRTGENIESLLKRFNNAVNKSGILKELKKRQHYRKPSEKKRDEIKESLYNKGKNRNRNKRVKE